MIILATDSGLARTGYALFAQNNGESRLMQYGCITTEKKMNLEKRLGKIYDDFEIVVKKNNPQKIIIEQLFFNTNQKTVVSIAQTQGALLLLAARHALRVEFLTPLQIKQALTGYGRSDKKNVQKMVRLLLSLETMPKPDDVVDAIACGLAYCSIKKYDR